MASALENADYLAEQGWGRVRDLLHGRIVQYFGKDRPDRSRRFGYGFIIPVDDKGTVIQGADSVWFMASKGYFLRAAPSGSGLNWTYRHFIDTRTFLEPKIGDAVVFEQRPSRRRQSGYEVSCWTHEQEYLDALADLNKMQAGQAAKVTA